MRLASVAGFGSLLAASAILTERLPVLRPTGPTILSGRAWDLLPFLIPFVAGVAITLWAERRLRKGIKESVWADAELAPIRLRLESPMWIWLVIGMSVPCIVWYARGLQHPVTIVVLLFPLQTPMRLHQILKSRQDSPGSLLSEEFAPIRSEYWGESS
jgi:hypothetical protein